MKSPRESTVDFARPFCPTHTAADWRFAPTAGLDVKPSLRGPLSAGREGHGHAAVT